VVGRRVETAMYVIQNENTTQDCIVAQWVMTAVEQNASTHIIILYLIQSIFKIPKIVLIKLLYDYIAQ
jgi:hypothetical protein